MRGEDDAIERWERWAADDRRRKAAHLRSRMRWWRHARDYLVMRRLVTDGLIKRKDEVVDLAVPAIPAHPPWSIPSNWLPQPPWHTTRWD